MITFPSSVYHVSERLKVKNVKIRDYSRFSMDCFNDELSEIDWDQIIANGANCVNKLFSSFYNKYTNTPR